MLESCLYREYNPKSNLVRKRGIETSKTDNLFFLLSLYTFRSSNFEFSRFFLPSISLMNVCN